MKKLLVLYGILRAVYGRFAPGTIPFSNTSAATNKVSINRVPGGAATGLTPAIATAGRLTGALNATVSQYLGTSSESVVIGWSAKIGTTISALEAFLAARSTLESGTPA